MIGRRVDLILSSAEHRSGLTASRWTNGHILRRQTLHCVSPNKEIFKTHIRPAHPSYIRASGRCLSLVVNRVASQPSCVQQCMGCTRSGECLFIVVNCCACVLCGNEDEVCSRPRHHNADIRGRVLIIKSGSMVSSCSETLINLSSEIAFWN
jgi:hypothetical protein